MTDISRSEFDALVSRVNRIERTLQATVEMMAAELLGLRSNLDEHFTNLDDRIAGLDERFTNLDEKVDAYSSQVNAALHAANTVAARHEQFTAAIAAHFGIELRES